MDNVEHDSLLNMGMGLLFGPDERERELWKMCDVKLRNRLQELQNLSFIRDSKKNDADAYKKYTSLLMGRYSELMDRYDSIDVSKLDARFKPDVIRRMNKKLKGMEFYIHDEKELGEYIKKELDPLMTEFFTPRYQMYRETVNELERHR